MKPVSQTPTEPRDYAALNAAWAASLTGLVLSGPGRGAGRELTEPRELVPLALATFALAKTVSREKVSSWLREPFVEESDPGARRPRGRRLRYAVGELLTCTRCMGTWSALGLVTLRLAAPTASRPVTAVLATSAANDFLQTAFTRLCAQSNAAERAAERFGSEAPGAAETFARARDLAASPDQVQDPVPTR
jgi:hypothetical protein